MVSEIPNDFFCAALRECFLLARKSLICRSICLGFPLWMESSKNYANITINLEGVV